MVMVLMTWYRRSFGIAKLTTWIASHPREAFVIWMLSGLAFWLLCWVAANAVLYWLWRLALRAAMRRGGNPVNWCLILMVSMFFQMEPYPLTIVRIGDVSHPVMVNGVTDLLITSPVPFTLTVDGCERGTLRQVENAHGIIATIPILARRLDWLVTVSYVMPQGVWMAQVRGTTRLYLPLIRR